MGERPPFVLIWGVSRAGKSQYCQWLAQRGYTYLDNDTFFGRLQQASPLEKAWALMRNGQMTAKQFVDAIAGQREEFWRIQMAWVDHAWLSIADILNARIIRTIGPGRAYLAETQIDRLMFGVLDDQS